MSRRSSGAPSPFGSAGEHQTGDAAEGHGDNGGDGGDDSDDVQITGTVDYGTRLRSRTGAASMSRCEPPSTEELARLAQGFMGSEWFHNYIQERSNEDSGGSCSQPPEQRRQVTSGGPPSSGGRPPRAPGGSLFQSGPPPSRADPPPRQPAARRPPAAVSAAGVTAHPSRGAAGGPSTGGAPAYKRSRSASFHQPEDNDWGGGVEAASQTGAAAGVYGDPGAGGAYSSISSGGASAMRRARSAPEAVPGILDVCSPTNHDVLRVYRNIGQRDHKSVAIFPMLRDDAPVTSFSLGLRPEELKDCRRCGRSIPIRRSVFIRLVGFAPTAATSVPRFYRGPGAGQGIRIGAVAYCSPLCVGNIQVDPSLMDLSPHGPPIPSAMKGDEWDVTRLVLTPQVSCLIADKDEGHRHEALPPEFLIRISEWIREGYRMPAQLHDAVNDYYNPEDGV